MPMELRAGYESHMASKGFPANAVAKDVEFIQARLRRPRKIVMTSGIQISGPSEEFNQLVEILPSEDAAHTLVKIQGAIQSRD